ncbi:DUF3772 domain-containing protein [Paracoccus sp. S-4012]|uniref:DUF3772 domain-containing protein n=1 Tax=Paracoccus sp. S-4012 TaxID=2665648 RepID=UPI0012B06CCC|nr:DUF3772 domain-containing protein [Paracoccus sp. S-4012]MRX51325.1 DUF3772 domain-containing protein [Paracoccus sp. S-4012]
MSATAFPVVQVRTLILALLLGLAAALAAAAQTPGPDYTAWENFAERAEAALDGGDLGDGELQRLRADVVDWRAQFLAAQNVRSTRLATLRDQVAALGPPPAEGAEEAADVAARRADLRAEIEVEQAPALRATEAYGRADGLVAQIDRARRGLQATAVLRQTPSPLLPSSWAAALGDGMALLTGLVTDTQAALTETAFGPRAAQSLLLLAVAVLLLTAGRAWVDRLPARLSARLSPGASGAVDFLASLGQIVLPVAGVWLVALAFDRGGLVGDWGRPFLHAAPVAGFSFFAGRWIAQNLLPPHPDEPAILELKPPRRHRARRKAIVLAAAFALYQLLSRAMLPLAGIDHEDADFSSVPVIFSDAAGGVWHLPMILVGSFALLRLGHLLRRPEPGDTAELMPPLDRVFAAAASLSRLVALIAPLAALLGWTSLANAILWPTAITLAVIGVVLLLQKFIADLWLLITGSREGANTALAPVLIGFGLVLAAFPVLALVWGARVEDLAEVWTRAGQGLAIGTFRLSPGAILTFFIVFSVGYAITRVVQSAFRNSILPRTRMDRGGQSAIVSGLGYLGIVMAAIIAILAAGIDLSSLAIVAGALSVGIGFGLQNVVSNFVSGIILLIERPVTVGDWVRVGGAEGYVRKMSVRSTQIQTFDRTIVVVPNQDFIAKEVTNWTRGTSAGRIIVRVPVAHGSNTRRVAAMLQEIAEDQPTVLIEPAPSTVFMGFHADGLDFEIRAVLSDINQGLSVSSEIRHQIIERFAAEGIQIPFAQRDVWVRNPEALPAPVPPVVGAGDAREDAERQGPKRPRARREEDDELDPRIAGASASGLEDAGDDGDGDGDGPGQR